MSTTSSRCVPGRGSLDNTYDFLRKYARVTPQVWQLLVRLRCPSFLVLRKPTGNRNRLFPIDPKLREATQSAESPTYRVLPDTRIPKISWQSTYWFNFHTQMCVNVFFSAASRTSSYHMLMALLSAANLLRESKSTHDHSWFFSYPNCRDAILLAALICYI